MSRASPRSSSPPAPCTWPAPGLRAADPRALPAPRSLVHLSGVAELLCGAGLLYPRTRRAAGWASAVLLVAIYPGNVQMCLSHAQRATRRRDAASRAAFAATLARLPLQLPLIRTALRAAGRI